ncbi:hypothetical protein [Gordonia humi]|uniref:Uncharacterized protein YaaW (UPF0174 family) n=1 Tax=Gordonia humi TaxID=686429 RepID=A0A840EVF3_9ACTN|nr:hypothetical protein [Gordonia humi]MBB4135541.1 uncharacterized protein YaaW (UPF0174 family) [Gordonia humi]
MIGVAVGLAAPVGILAPIAVHQSVHAAAAFAVQMWRATVSRVRTQVPTNRTWSTIEGATPVVVTTTMVFVGLDMAVPAYAATAASLLAAPTWILVRAHAPLMWRVVYAVIAASLVATAYQIALAGLSAGPAGLIALPTISYLFGRLAFWWMRYAFVDVAAD